MKYFIAMGLSVVAIVIAALTLFGPSHSFGNTTQSFWDAKLGYRINGTSILSQASVTATSSLSIGKIQTTATSSATVICLVPSTAGATSTFAGTVYWKYGTCP